VTTLRSVPLLSLALAAVLAVGCRASDRGFGIQRQLDRPVQVQVNNHNFLDVTVYARGGGREVRLGEVSGKSSGKLSIDPRRVNMTTGLQLLVDPIGSTRVFLSQAVFPDRDAVVVLQVGAELEMSFVSLR
jgi:hypothetical protein